MEEDGDVLDWSAGARTADVDCFRRLRVAGSLDGEDRRRTLRECTASWELPLSGWFLPLPRLSLRPSAAVCLVWWLLKLSAFSCLCVHCSSLVSVKVNVQRCVMVEICAKGTFQLGLIWMVVVRVWMVGLTRCPRSTSDLVTTRHFHVALS